jgi:FkbM family methyltransferase
MNIIHEWILKNISDTPIIVEAGVCDGLDTEFFAKSFPNGKIYGFEPIYELFQQASDRNCNYSNVIINQLALGEKSEETTFYVSDRFGKKWGSSSMLKPKKHIDIHKEITFNSEDTLKTVNLDEWCFSNKIESAELMWLDLQGLEPIVIKSSPNIISKTKFIYSEVSLIETYENVTLYKDFKNYMESINFRVVFEDLSWEDMGNVLFQNINL